MHDLRLLYLCFSSAEAAEANVAGDVVGISVRDITRRLVDENRLLDFEHIFPVYMSVEPLQAVDEAATRGLADTLLTVEFLVEALRDPVVIGYVIERFIRARQESIWGVALAEAALRYPFVAQILGESDSIGEFSIRRGNSWLHRWAKVTVLKNTLYGDVLLDVADYYPSGKGVASMNLSPLVYYGTRGQLSGDDHDIRVLLNLEENTAWWKSWQKGTVLVFERPGGTVDIWGPDLLVGCKVVAAERVRGDVRAELLHRVLFVSGGVPTAQFISMCIVTGAVSRLSGVDGLDEWDAFHRRRWLPRMRKQWYVSERNNFHILSE